MKWSVGDKVRFRLWDGNKNSIFVTGRVTSRVPSQQILNVMDERGHMWRVGYGTP